MNRKGNTIGFPALAGVLAVLILFIGSSPGKAAGAETSWIFDADAGISHFDNVNNASSPAGKKSDDVSFLLLTGGSYFQIAEYTGSGKNNHQRVDAGKGKGAIHNKEPRKGGGKR